MSPSEEEYPGQGRTCDKAQKNKWCPDQLCRICRDSIGVKEEPAQTQKCQNQPANGLAIGPLHRGTELFREDRLLKCSRAGSTDHQVRSTAGNYGSAKSRMAPAMAKPFLVCQRNLPEIAAVTLWAVQIHLFTPSTGSLTLDPSCRARGVPGRTHPRSVQSEPTSAGLVARSHVMPTTSETVCPARTARETDILEHNSGS